LIRAFAAYRRDAEMSGQQAWDLVLCGNGPEACAIGAEIVANGLVSAVHRPGFLQSDALARWYAFAGAFVHPSLMEPWGLVVNEAAACGLPLLVSDRAGCVETLVPHDSRTSGMRFDPTKVEEIRGVLTLMAEMPESERQARGKRAAEIVEAWGPERFAV